MKSNKEILAAKIDCPEYDIRTEIFCYHTYENEKKHYVAILEAMDEARRESSIGFAEWMDETEIRFSNYDGCYTSLKDKKITAKDSSELYSLYLESINK